jgi:transposase
MEIIVSRAAGIDIGKATLKATVRIQGGPKRATRREVRTFGTTTGQLLMLRDWLVAEQVELVGMESTGVFWKPIYYILEDVVECWLLNAQHLKKVPRRKTDVTDSEWIAELVAHGLVRPSFVPPPGIRRLRDLTRYRTALTEDRTRDPAAAERSRRRRGEAGFVRSTSRATAPADSAPTTSTSPPAHRINRRRPIGRRSPAP